MSDASRKKFDALRERYVARKAAREALSSELREKYGSEPPRSWLTRGERAAVDRIDSAMDVAQIRFFVHLREISPRDWSYGVPAWWVYENLTYEDAVRPVGEKLSVVPPMAYGATAPRT